MEFKTVSSKFFIFAMMIAGSFIFTSCDPEEPEEENDEEVITTLNYTLTSTDGDVATFSFVDVDGDGPGMALVTNATLAANTAYAGVIELLNETEDPIEDITEEVAEEDDEHQLFFSSSLSDLSVAYVDLDGNGDPVGLVTSLITGAPGTGTLTITLIHEPEKDASGVSGGDISNAGGETDIQVTFDVTVQ